MNCSHLYLLSTIACQISDCLNEKETAVLSADLMTLADMLASNLARQDLCETLSSKSEYNAESESDPASDCSNP